MHLTRCNSLRLYTPELDPLVPATMALHLACITILNILRLIGAPRIGSERPETSFPHPGTRFFVFSCTMHHAPWAFGPCRFLTGSSYRACTVVDGVC